MRRRRQKPPPSHLELQRTYYLILFVLFFNFILHINYCVIGPRAAWSCVCKFIICVDNKGLLARTLRCKTLICHILSDRDVSKLRGQNVN